MNKRIIAFGASSSKQSINKKLAAYTAKRVIGTDAVLLDLNDFEMPIFSIDKERESGIPDLAYKFKSHLRESDGIIISFAEHNGAYSTAFKNIFDWISRIETDVWMNKPMFLLATSPGGRGGKTVLEIAVNKFTRMNKNIIAYFSLPSFSKNFSQKEGIIDSALHEEFDNQLKIFKDAL